ncbi:hypothetical protein L9F63_000742 [Diploptera punctata]|uniref:ABC transporter domain-containing protein n=1 Tax=Diploptera punctata TaxID=6984 RepID=A0AAD8ETH8_DIPPU|nr:hypothetical protein L9F63_000742 [Diploptera punctata]
MGPSGSGKSSFLNVLSGFKINGITGSILVNGIERSAEEIRRKSCYILQDCYFMELLTTRETMNMAASFQLSPKIRFKDKQTMINDILELLGLTRSADTRVKKLSGGEKKRLSIAQELLTNPPVMFFDEPTSGLDSSSSLQVISHLRSLAQGGRTIVCIIHQPSSRLFEMFDDLYLLSEGKCLYSGPINDMTAVFQEAGFQCPQYYNRADFAVEVACHERPGNIEKLISKNEHETERNDENATENSFMLSPAYHTLYPSVEILSEGSRYALSVWRQMVVLLRRSSKCTIRDLHLAQLRVAAHLVIGLFMGGVFYGVGNEASKVASNTACLVFFMMFIFFCNLFPYVHSFPSEKRVVMREHLNNWYSLEAYHIAKLLAEFPLQVLCPSVFLLPAYFLSSQPMDGTRFIQFWAVLVIITLLAQALGLVTGTIVKPQMGVFVVCIVSLPLLLFSGFYLRIQDMHISIHWLSYISFFRHSFEAMMACIYGYDRPNLKCSEAYCHFKSPKKFLGEFGMEHNVYWFDMLGLAIWIIILQLLLQLLLHIKFRISR